MGIDLRLLPYKHWHEQQDGTLWGCSHTILDLRGISQEASLAVKTGDLAAAALSDGMIERELTRYACVELAVAGHAGDGESPA